jgi:hypothetical protein
VLSQHYFNTFTCPDQCYKNNFDTQAPPLLPLQRDQCYKNNFDTQASPLLPLQRDQCYKNNFDTQASPLLPLQRLCRPPGLWMLSWLLQTRQCPVCVGSARTVYIPYTYTVHDRTFCEFPARNTVYTVLRF